MTNTQRAWAIIIIVIVVIGLAVFFWHARPASAPVSNTGAVPVVAAENFWGSIVAQIGGSDISLTTIVSDPNADPHEYESTTDDARAIASAKYVVVNGAGYDSWADKLISGSPSSDRKVLTVADLIGKKEGDNPHFWYDPDYVNAVAQQVETDLAAIDPAHAADYEANYAKLETALAGYQGRIASIKQQFGGTEVAATEDIFAYLADAAGLDLVSPPAFTEAVAEGNDPPAASIVTFENQLKSGDVKVLVYNEQTVTPLTESVKKMAADEGIPVVGITETLQPVGAPFQDWMDAEITNLQDALATTTGA